jgi:hypothetical protein
MNKDLINKIKSRGYWRINFQPTVYTQKISSLGKCRSIVEKNAVNLRGWDYPHIPLKESENTGVEPGKNFIQGWIDFGRFKEFWRMYQSGQFIHYRALLEDWLEEDEWTPSLAATIKPFTKIGVVSSIVYQITEIFEFLARLTRDGIYDEGASVAIGLYNTEGRELRMDVPGRMPLYLCYKTPLKEIEFAERFSKDRILTHSRELALDVIVFIFERFNWFNLPRDAIRKDQEDLLSGRV